MQKPEYPLIHERMFLELDPKVHGPLKRIRASLVQLTDDINLLDSVDGVEAHIAQAYAAVARCWGACNRAARREAIEEPAHEPGDPSETPFMQAILKPAKGRKPKA